MKKKSKKTKCDCADVIDRNQVCDICQDVEESFADGSLIPDQHLKKEHIDDRWEGEFYIIDQRAEVTWELFPFCNDRMITINLVKAPNIFYRWMMTLFFGFRWKRIK